MKTPDLNQDEQSLIVNQEKPSGLERLWLIAIIFLIFGSICLRVFITHQAKYPRSEDCQSGNLNCLVDYMQEVVK